MAVFQHSKPSSEGKCHSRLRFMPTRRLLSAVWHLVLKRCRLRAISCQLARLIPRWAIDKKLADLFAAKPKLFWIGIGNTDFLFKDNTAFREKLTKNHYPFTYMETDGGHIWRNWRIYLGEFAQKIFK